MSLPLVPLRSKIVLATATLVCFTNITVSQEFTHPPIPDRDTADIELPEGFTAYETMMSCVNDQRKMRSLLPRDYERSPFARGEQMERELGRICRGAGGVVLGPSEEALRAQLDAFNAPDTETK